MASKTETKAAAAPARLSAGELLGGGVLKRINAPISGLFDGFDSNKISASSKSRHGENVVLEFSGSTSNFAADNRSAVNSATLRLNQKNYGVATTASSTGKLSLDVSVAEPIKGASVTAGAIYEKGSTTVKSSIDYKNERVTGNASFSYPWGGALAADASVVVFQSGVSAGARAAVSASKADGKSAVTVSAIEAGVSYQKGSVQVGAVYAQDKNGSRVTAAVAADVKDGAKAAVLAVLPFSSEKKVKNPEVRIAGRFKVNDVHAVRATVSALPTADVALQLASQWNKDLKTSFTVGAKLADKKPQVAFGLGVDLQH